MGVQRRAGDWDRRPLRRFSRNRLATLSFYALFDTSTHFFRTSRGVSGFPKITLKFKKVNDHLETEIQCVLLKLKF